MVHTCEEKPLPHAPRSARRPMAGMRASELAPSRRAWALRLQWKLKAFCEGLVAPKDLSLGGAFVIAVTVVAEDGDDDVTRYGHLASGNVEVPRVPYRQNWLVCVDTGERRAGQIILKYAASKHVHVKTDTVVDGAFADEIQCAPFQHETEASFTRHIVAVMPPLRRISKIRLEKLDVQYLLGDQFVVQGVCGAAVLVRASDEVTPPTTAQAPKGNAAAAAKKSGDWAAMLGRRLQRTVPEDVVLALTDGNEEAAVQELAADIGAMCDEAASSSSDGEADGTPQQADHVTDGEPQEPAGRLEQLRCRALHELGRMECLDDVCAVLEMTEENWRFKFRGATEWLGSCRVTFECRIFCVDCSAHSRNGKRCKAMVEHDGQIGACECEAAMWLAASQYVSYEAHSAMASQWRELRNSRRTAQLSASSSGAGGSGS